MGRRQRQVCIRDSKYIEAAHRAGAKGILVKTGYGAAALSGEGPDTETPAGKPEFIADNNLEAVRLILEDRP